MGDLLRKHRFALMIAIAVLAGVLIRLYLIIKSNWRIDYDEGMLGLTGFQVMRGQWPLHVPGQTTLGSLEAYLLALLFWLIGPNVISLRLLSLIYSAFYVITIGLIGRCAFDRRTGALAAFLAAIAPVYMLVTGMKAWAGTIETILLGNCLLLAVFYTVENANSPRQQRVGIALIGFIAGISFWIAWSCFYYWIPVGLILLWKGRQALWRNLPLAVIAFGIGSLPFWVFNATSGFATFTTQQRAEPMTLEQVGLILAHYWSDLMPRMVSGDPLWRAIGPNGLIVLLILYYAGQLALWVWPFAGPWKGHPGFSLRAMLAILVISVPAVYLVSSYGLSAFNPWGLDATGRYVLMMHTALPLGLAALVVAIASPVGRSGQTGRANRLVRAGIAMLLAGSVLALNFLGSVRANTQIAFDSPYYDRSPETLDPLIAYLDQQHITHIWVDTAIGNVLMFVTREHILTGDYYDVIIAGGRNRMPAQLEAVSRASRTAFVIVVQPGQQNPPLQQALDQAGIHYTFKAVTPTVYVYIPDRRVDPAEVANGLGYQYWIPPSGK